MKAFSLSSQIRVPQNGQTFQFPSYAASTVFFSICIYNINTQTLIDASKDVGLEVNVDKTKYMLVSGDQNAGQNREIKIGNRSFENVSQFKFWERQ
jgi:hypothetical protein